MSVEALVAWAAAGGAYADPIEIRVGPDGNRSVFARRTIARDELVLAVPRTLIVGADDIAATPLGQATQGFASMLHSRYMPIALWLANTRHSSESPWAPYLDALPASFPVWTPGVLTALEGTRAGALLQQRERQLEDDRALVADLLGELATRAVATLDWALRTARSRCFELASTGGCALVPIADMIDHAPVANAVWTYQVETARLEFRAACEISPNEEILHRYGTYDNAHWLAGYGFVLENNPDDEVTLQLGSDATDMHVGTRFDARFQRATAVAHGIAGDADPRASLRVLDAASRRADLRIASNTADVVGDERMTHMCRIVRAGERAVLAEIMTFVARASELVTRAPAERRAFAERIATEAVGADRLLREFLLAGA